MPRTGAGGDNPRKAFPLRLDGRLYEELRRWADAELRSVNGQIEFILRRAVEERRGRARRTSPPNPDSSAPDQAAEG